MGRTPKPLRIGLLPPADQWEEFKTLKEQGHTVTVLNDDFGFDIILGESAWHLTETERKYLPLAIKAARKRRYPKEPDE